jgi:hypothetical protein
MKRIAHQSAGVPVLTDATTSWTLTDADMNSYLIATNAGAITVTLNTGVGEKGNVILIEQGGAGQITVSGTATINNANGTKTTAQKSVICLVSTATDVWTLFGDATT